MPGKTPFRLNRSGLLLALISTAFAGQAQATAGRVEFAIGPATVVGVDGRTRPAARGTQLDTGDVVRTNDGRVQMRMVDGAFISLQPNTEFGIKEYKYAGKPDGSENALFSLVKGAMRTVTGLIGRINRNRFQVATPTATVGIRGTGGLIEILQDGATLVQGTSGIWYLANPAGTIDIPAGVAGIAPVDPKQPPKETVQIPTAGPSPLPALIEFVQGEERESDGTSVITGDVLQSGSGYAAVLAFGANFDGPTPALVLDVDSAVFNGSGQLTEFGSDLRSGGIYRLEAGGSHADFGTDGILAWGRWIGPVTIPGLLGTENYDANQGLHYVVGLPTASMPTTGQATYNLLGATRPTYTDGTAAPGSFSGNLFVDFQAMLVGMTLAVGIDGNTYSIGGAALISGNTFSGFGSAFGKDPLTISGGGCFCSCSVQVDGFFAGTNAERAGLGYLIEDGFTGKDVVGTAAFTK
jgi:hypothetical protein